MRASAIAAASVAVKLRPLPPQMTYLPGPAAMRASKANPTTMIKSPPAPHFADQNHTTVPRTTSKLLPLAAPTHHDQLFPFGRSHAQPRWPQRLRTSPSFRIVLANLSRSSRKSLVRGLARLLTLGSGKNCEINWRDSWAECPEGDDDPDICPVDDVRADRRSCGRAAITSAATARRFADGAGQ